MYRFDNDNDTDSVITMLTAALIQRRVLHRSPEFLFFLCVFLSLVVFALVSMDFEDERKAVSVAFTRLCLISCLILVVPLKYSINGQVSFIKCGRRV